LLSWVEGGRSEILQGNPFYAFRNPRLEEGTPELRKRKRSTEGTGGWELSQITSPSDLIEGDGGRARGQHATPQGVKDRKDLQSPEKVAISATEKDLD